MLTLKRSDLKIKDDSARICVDIDEDYPSNNYENNNWLLENKL